MSLQLDNESFSQELEGTFQQNPDDMDFEVKRRGRRSLRQKAKGSIRRLRGIPVYSKTGKRHKGFWSKVRG